MTPPCERPLCSCHGLPMWWHKDSHRKAGGFWRCAERKLESQREFQRAWYRARRATDSEWVERERERKREYRARRATDPEWLERKREQDREFWHRANGGYIQKRKRQLAGQRAQILDALAQLREQEEQIRVAKP